MLKIIWNKISTTVGFVVGMVLGVLSLGSYIIMGGSMLIGILAWCVIIAVAVVVFIWSDTVKIDDDETSRS